MNHFVTHQTLEKVLDPMGKQKFTGEYKGFKLSTAFDWMNNSPYIQAVNATDFRIDIYGSKKCILSAIKGIDKQIDKKITEEMDFTKLEGKSDIERTYFFRAAEALTRNGNAYSPDNAMSTDKGIADAMIAKGYDLEKIYKTIEELSPRFLRYIRTRE